MTDHDLPPADGPAADLNREAVAAAGLDDAMARWITSVIDIIEPRLDLVRSDWQESADPAVARACAFGLLLGSLAGKHPETIPALSRVAEAHAAYGTLPEGERLATLQRIVESPALTLEWVGPVFDVHDVAAIEPLRV